MHRHSITNTKTDLSTLILHNDILLKAQQHIHVDFEKNSSCAHGHHHPLSDRNHHGSHPHKHKKKNNTKNDLNAIEMKELDLGGMNVSKISHGEHDHRSNCKYSHSNNHNHCHNHAHKHKKKNKFKTETNSYDIKPDVHNDLDVDSKIIKEENSDFTEDDNNKKKVNEHSETKHQCNNHHKHSHKIDHHTNEEEKCPDIFHNSNNNMNNISYVDKDEDDFIYKIKIKPLNKAVENKSSNSNKSSQFNKTATIPSNLIKNFNNENDFAIQRTNVKRKSDTQKKSPRLSGLRKNIYIIILFIKSLIY
jgi:hypothetical protein